MPDNATSQAPRSVSRTWTAPLSDEAEQGRGFAGRDWEELPDDRDLAVEAAARHLHDLNARLPSGPYTTNELPALGYNTR